MTMLSFRVEEATAEVVNDWCRRLGVDRSTLLRESLRLHIDRLRSEDEAEWIGDEPASPALDAFAEVSAWLPQEDWAAWAEPTTGPGDDAAG